MKKLILLAVLVLVLGAHPSWAADASWQQVKENNRLTVGFCAHYPPFESRNEKTNELEGFDVDMGRALAQAMGVAPAFVDAEWQGGLKKGDYDILITCMSKSEARADQVNMSDVYYRLPDVMVVNKKNTAIKTRADLKGKTVGVQVGSGSEQIADKMAADFKEIKRYNYNPEAFTDLAHGRIDAVIVGYAYAVTQIKKTPAFKVVGKPLHEAEIVMVMKSGADQLTQKVNQALAAIQSNGTYEAILNKWLALD
ncbi:MAG: amino acid ABC transporter substrate-binding protein [Desulfobacter sp.]|nr:MAG: amino acid ABC transporter substrate-binding protein [Desulfobacter sp.]